MAKKRRKPVAQVLGERVDMRMTRNEKQLFQDAATRQGISLSHWLRLAAWTIVKQHDSKVQLVNLDAN
jgi:hypothetical protein